MIVFSHFVLVYLPKQWAQIVSDLNLTGGATGAAPLPVGEGEVSHGIRGTAVCQGVS